MKVRRLNAGEVAEMATFDTKRCHLVRSQVYHTERLPCSTFAVMLRVARICQRQLILVIP